MDNTRSSRDGSGECKFTVIRESACALKEKSGCSAPPGSKDLTHCPQFRPGLTTRSFAHMPCPNFSKIIFNDPSSKSSPQSGWTVNYYLKISHNFNNCIFSKYWLFVGLVDWLTKQKQFIYLYVLTCLLC